MKTNFGNLVTTVCPCGRIHNMNPNQKSSVYCFQCNTEYDRKERVWREPQSGIIIESNSRPYVRKRKGIEQGDYCEE